jgi:ABC-type branched-subunit amino acid transport system ATPase component
MTAPREMPDPVEDGALARADGDAVRADDVEVDVNGAAGRADGAVGRADDAAPGGDGTVARADGAAGRADDASPGVAGAAARADDAAVPVGGATARERVAVADGEVAVLEGRDVAVHFGGVKAVDGLSFRITPGKIFGIMGPNGSGKSTLLGAISRLVPLTRGELLLDGEDFNRVPPSGVARLRVARTFQTVRLLSDLTVLENIQLGGDLRPFTPDADAPPGDPWWRNLWGRGEPSAAVREAIERTRLTGLEQARPGELSYGTQRRVEIARALAMRPRLLLLDEPTAGMNQGERREIGALLQRLRGEGLTQLLVEHDVQMMIDTCDYVLSMNFGKLIAEGPPDQVVRDPAVQQAYLGKKWRAQHA